MTKKKQVKSNSDVSKIEAQKRINDFNTKLRDLAEKYEVKLDVTQRIVVVDNKTSK